MPLSLSLEPLEDRTLPSGLAGVNSSTPIPIAPAPDSRPVLISAAADLTSSRDMRDGHRLGFILSVADVIGTLEGNGNRTGIPRAAEPEDLASAISLPGNDLHGEGFVAGQSPWTPGALLEMSGQFLSLLDGFPADAFWSVGQAGTGDGRIEMALARPLEAVLRDGWADRVPAWGSAAPAGRAPLPPEAELGAAANKDLTIIAASLNGGRMRNPSPGDTPSVPDPPPGPGREPALGGLTDFIVGTPDPGHRAQGRRLEGDASTQPPPVSGAQAEPPAGPPHGMTEGEE